MTTTIPNPKLVSKIAAGITAVMTGMRDAQTATERATGAVHALSQYVERAGTINALAFVRHALDKPQFADAAPKTRRRWIERIDERVHESIVSAVTAADVCFLLNATFTNHQFPATEETRVKWRCAAALRIHELESNMEQNRTDKERAQFMIRVIEAEVILSMREMKFANAIQPLCRTIAADQGGDFTLMQREGIDTIMAKHTGKV